MLLFPATFILIQYTYQMYLQRMVDEEELQFHEEYMNEKDPSILHFLLASGDDVWHEYLIYLLLYLVMQFQFHNEVLHYFAGLK